LSSSSSSGNDSDDGYANAPGGPDGPDGLDGGPGPVDDHDSDDSVVVLYDSSVRRGQGDGAALLQFRDVANVLSNALDNLPQNPQPVDDANLETFLGTVVSSIVFEYQ
jgi:hypothetical protein